MGLVARKPVFGGLRNKGADQPAHLCRMISPFVIHFLESIISKLATIKISIFQLVSIAEENCLTQMQTARTGFVVSWPV